MNHVNSSTIRTFSFNLNEIKVLGKAVRYQLEESQSELDKVVLNELLGFLE